ncbi:MAG: hypothetical protein WC117_00335 [Sphaerochaetaceae bacterium]
MEKYTCTTCPTDELTVYQGVSDDLSFVMVDAAERKISTILSKEDVERLHRQLTDYLSKQK